MFLGAFTVKIGVQRAELPMFKLVRPILSGAPRSHFECPPDANTEKINAISVASVPMHKLTPGDKPRFIPTGYTDRQERVNS